MSVRVAEDERSRLAEASWALYGRGAGTVVVDGLLATGARSRVWRLVAVGREGTRHYAVKWFRPHYRSGWAGADAGDPPDPVDPAAPAAPGGSVATEYAALASLIRALPELATGRFRLRCPVPVQAWDWGYAMSAVPGYRLDDVVAHRQLAAAEYPQLARELVAALIAFHASSGGPYGDFHPGNVLLGPDRDVYLLDPAPAAGWLPSWAGEPAPPHLAVDVAHWVYATALAGLRQVARHPVVVARCGQLARALAGAAVELTGDRALAGQIDRCLIDYWAELGRRGAGHRAVAAAASRYLDPRRPRRQRRQRWSGL